MMQLRELGPWAAQEPIQWTKTKRQIKALSHTGILTTRDANRSIETRKAKKDAAGEKLVAKGYRKDTAASHYIQPGLQESGTSIEATIVVQENGEVYYLDLSPLC